MVGRAKPYTAIGVRRLFCARCKIQKARFQWSACANQHKFVPVCADCDIYINSVFLELCDIPDRKILMEKYTATVKAGE